MRSQTFQFNIQNFYLQSALQKHAPLMLQLPQRKKLIRMKKVSQKFYCDFYYKFVMIVGVGSVLLTLGLLANDIRKRKQKKQEKKNLETIHICLTGGPCGGKSEGINMLYNSMKNITVPVFIVPEAATIIGSAGFTLDLSKCTPREIELFQISLMRLQLNLENLVTELARNFNRENKKSVVLCDRGMLDGKAYAGDDNWAKMLRQIKIDEDEILGRYEAVVHMVTAAEGAQEYYNLGNNVRHETIDFAIELDRKIQRCYQNHPSRYIITNEFIVNNFEDKKLVLLAQVYQILLKLIQENNIIEYYQDYVTKMRKGSEDDIVPSMSPYMLRKLKYKRFMRRQGNVKVGYNNGQKR